MKRIFWPESQECIMCPHATLDNSLGVEPSTYICHLEGCVKEFEE